MAQRDPPNPEFLHLVPGLIPKPKPAASAAQAMWPSHNSALEDQNKRGSMSPLGGAAAITKPRARGRG
jgi:hypothetical protein